MSTRRRLSGDFKAKVALEALRGDTNRSETASESSRCQSSTNVFGLNPAPLGQGRVG